MLTARMGWAIVATAFVLPWCTWLTVTTSNQNEAVVQTPLWGFVLMGLGLLSLLIATKDKWAGLLAGYLVLRALPGDHLIGVETVFLMMLGLFAMLAVREIPSGQQEWLIRMLVIVGMLEACYLLVQWLGYDPIWSGWKQAPPLLQGTLGNKSYVAAFLGMIVPLAPLWISPWLFAAIFLTQSVMGLVAAVVGLLVAHRLPGKVVLTVLSGTGLLLLAYPHVWASWITRWVVWESLLTDQTWWTLVIGHGPGAWASAPRLAYGELFVQAHSEYLQLFYEGGLLALLCVAGWIWFYQRQISESRFAGSVAAIAVCSLTMFPFHLAIPGLTAMVLLGAATHDRWREEVPCAPGR